MGKNLAVPPKNQTQLGGCFLRRTTSCASAAGPLDSSRTACRWHNRPRSGTRSRNRLRGNYL